MRRLMVALVAFSNMRWACVVSHGWDTSSREQRLIDEGSGAEAFSEGRHRCLTPDQKMRWHLLHRARAGLEEQLEEVRVEFARIEAEMNAIRERLQKQANDEWCDGASVEL